MEIMEASSRSALLSVTSSPLQDFFNLVVAASLDESAFNSLNDDLGRVLKRVTDDHLLEEYDEGLVVDQLAQVAPAPVPAAPAAAAAAPPVANEARLSGNPPATLVAALASAKRCGSPRAAAASIFSDNIVAEPGSLGKKQKQKQKQKQQQQQQQKTTKKKAGKGTPSGSKSTGPRSAYAQTRAVHRADHGSWSDNTHVLKLGAAASVLDIVSAVRRKLKAKRMKARDIFSALGGVDGGTVSVDQFTAQMQAAGLLLEDEQVGRMFGYLRWLLDGHQDEEAAAAAAKELSFEGVCRLMGTVQPPRENGRKPPPTKKKMKAGGQKNKNTNKNKKAAAAKGGMLFQAATAG